MAIQTLQAQVDAWTKKSTARVTAVVQESTQRLIEQANTVGPSVANPTGGAGGKMPIDTGFLRASMAVSFDGMPAGPSRMGRRENAGTSRLRDIRRGDAWRDATAETAQGRPWQMAGHGTRAGRGTSR